MSPDTLLGIARAFMLTGAILGLLGVISGLILVVAYVHDRVRRLGWRGWVRQLCSRPHPVDELARRHRQPDAHPQFTRHRRAAR